MTRTLTFMAYAGLATLLMLSLSLQYAFAYNTWGDYHWARTTNPLPLELGNNLSGDWPSYLAITSTNWNVSDVLQTSVQSGNGGRNCKATNGRVEVCNRTYGNNGWLGIAQIWVDGNDHITQGTVKVNDTYFNTSTYNTPGWKQMVMCQEVGHTFGLDHQDENFDNPNLGTCMDYTNDPTRNDGVGNNLAPNAADYTTLDYIYAHTDSYDTYTTSTGGGGGGGGTGGSGHGGGNHGGHGGKPADVGQNIDLNNPSAWGQAVRTDAHGNASLYSKDLGNGHKLFTFVTWAG